MFGLKKLFGGSPSPLKRLAKTRGFKQDVVGESHYQKQLSKICGGKDEFGVKFECDAVVSCNHPNKFSDEAITILMNGSIVGFIAENEIAEFRVEISKLDSSMPDFVASAKVVGGWSRDDGEGDFGVKLNVKRPLKLDTK